MDLTDEDSPLPLPGTRLLRARLVLPLNMNGIAPVLMSGHGEEARTEDRRVPRSATKSRGGDALTPPLRLWHLSKPRIDVLLHNMAGCWEEEDGVQYEPMPLSLPADWRIPGWCKQLGQTPLPAMDKQGTHTRST